MQAQPSTLALRNPATGRWLAGAVVGWFAVVTVSSALGWLERIALPYFALLVAIGIAVPVGVYAAVAPVRLWVASVGLYPLTLMHAWRVPAALLFFGYGAAGTLPPLFWVLAGVGDLIAGWMAWSLRGAPFDRLRYRRFHVFGFADFVVAVGTGLAFTLMGDPRMQALATLPLAWIPLFGVGLSGATHLIAFDLLRRGDRTAA